MYCSGFIGFVVILFEVHSGHRVHVQCSALWVGSVDSKEL